MVSERNELKTNLVSSDVKTVVAYMIEQFKISTENDSAEFKVSLGNHTKASGSSI